MKCFLLTLSLCAGISFSAYCQSQSLNPTFENVAPPSPNAAALGKFGNVPVGLSTGVPSVSVPIFTWEGKNFGKTINISLDYHAGGVQVDEMASNVGLGWALNAGGVISRTMRGIQDEYPIDGFLYNTLPISEYDGNAPRSYPSNERIFNRMYDGKSDSQNDLFSFNFNGRSGRFIFGKNNDILLLDRSKLKIEKIIPNPNAFDAKITKFIITDEFGYKYEFSDYEVTSTTVGGVIPPHVSSWYLSKIINPSGTDNIIFEYEDYFLATVQTGRNQTWATPVTLDGASEVANMGGNSSQSVNGKRIRKINFTDNRTVTFQYKQAVRSDLTSASTDKALEKIIIANGTETYGYLLTQNYSLGGPIGSPVAGRLTLTSVQQYGSSEAETLNPYQFIYSTINSLPARFSGAKDHWGFPNANSSADQIPKEYLLVGGDNTPYGPYREYGGGNRDTDPEKVKAGSLTKIIYPTGGYTEFEMEANRAVDTWLNKAISIQVPKPYLDFSDGFGYNSKEYTTGIPITYSGASNTNVQFTISANSINNYNACSHCYLVVEVYRTGTSYPITTQNVNLYSTSSTPILKNFTLANLMTGDTFYLKTILASFDFTANGGHRYEYGTLSRRELNPPGSTTTVTFGTNQLYVGGLRAKKITDYTANGVAAISREYEYVLEDGSTPSGSLGYRPIYSYFVDYDVDGNGDGGPNYTFQPRTKYVVRTSSSVNEIPMINGSPVTYKRVVEKIGQNSVYTGKTVRNFSSFADSSPYISEDFPTIPAQYSTWVYGQLKSEDVYDSGNKLVKKTENLYEIFPDGYSGNQTRVENFRSISIAPVSFKWTGNQVTLKVNPSNYPVYFKMKSFMPIAGRSELSQSTVTDYVAGLPTAKIITDYNYDQNNFYLKESRTANSKGNVLKTTYTYPPDMVTAGEDVPTHSGMVALNIINPIIKETYFNGTTQTFMKKTSYKNWSGSLYAPELVSTKSGTFVEDIRLKYLKYDIHGSPVSVQKPSGPITTYIWGYGGERLVAVIENSPDYTTVTSLFGNLETFRNNKNPTDAVVNSFLAPLNTGFPNSLTTRYKYNPLSGLISSTDPKGMVTSYEYDGFQRLQSVKDQNGNIVKNYDYHYKP